MQPVSPVARSVSKGSKDPPSHSAARRNLLATMEFGYYDLGRHVRSPNCMVQQLRRALERRVVTDRGHSRANTLNMPATRALSASTIPASLRSPDSGASCARTPQEPSVGCGDTSASDASPVTAIKHQKPIGPYTVDFVRLKRRLVVKVAGSHESKFEYDQI